MLPQEIELSMADIERAVEESERRLEYWETHAEEKWHSTVECAEDLLMCALVRGNEQFLWEVLLVMDLMVAHEAKYGQTTYRR